MVYHIQLGEFILLISEEKKYLYKMMRDIVAERRKLTDTYYDLKKRLDVLTEMEEKGLESLSVQGYADSHNIEKENERIRKNVERESLKIVESLYRNHLSKIQSDSNDTAKQEQRDFVSDELKKQPEKADNTKFKKEIEKEKATKPFKKTRYSLEKMESLLVDILKSADSPMKTSELYDAMYDRLNGRFYTKSAFQKNILYRIKKNNDKIVNPTFGYYEYKED